jgi:uncharacterized repeat protein (TIGR01451 family)
LVLNVAAATPNGSVITNTASVTSPDDAVTANNPAGATTTVSGGANLLVLKSDSPDPVAVGGNITYTLTVRNDGPHAATSVTLNDVIPVNTTFVSVTPAAGWSCPSLPVGGTGTQTCTIATLAPLSSASFTLVVKVNPGTPSGTVITNIATVSSRNGGSQLHEQHGVHDHDGGSRGRPLRPRWRDHGDERLRDPERHAETTSSAEATVATRSMAAVGTT